jgi:hypothetical protein
LVPRYHRLWYLGTWYLGIGWYLGITDFGTWVPGLILVGTRLDTEVSRLIPDREGRGTDAEDGEVRPEVGGDHLQELRFSNFILKLMAKERR